MLTWLASLIYFLAYPFASFPKSSPFGGVQPRLRVLTSSISLFISRHCKTRFAAKESSSRLAKELGMSRRCPCDSSNGRRGYSRNSLGGQRMQDMQKTIVSTVFLGKIGI
ncbi:hypothetical protein GYMLUDRAFT_635161 [Collybiopsis luxurians FD-317 M1]|nr:hypothetical protein GYMLUDRAFT_635161 [Collybiopsis luxurians FD-317 M1]